MKKINLVLGLLLLAVFAFAQAEFSQITENFNDIDVGLASSPTFTDLDGDGLLDMLVGNRGGNIFHYEQDSINSTSFTLVTENFSGIDVGFYSTPTFTDLDNDGLLDMFSGENTGNINHYEQDSINSTSFTLVTANFNSIDVGGYNMATFTDLDGDDLLDMLVGENDGNINHYEQNSVNSLLFTLVTENFNNINVGTRSSLAFIDLDDDDLLDMFSGEYTGNINHYEQNSVNSTSFTLVTETFSGIDDGGYSSPTFTDLDGDGLFDMLIGLSSGNICHYEQENYDAPVPVILTNFTSVVAGEFVNISWTVESECGISKYNLYRGETAEVLIYSVNAENLTTTHTYEYQDSEIEVGTYTYWLESVENDGSSQIYDPCSVEVFEEDDENEDIPEEMIMGNYPNPFTNETTISFSLTEDATISSIEIYNTKGQLIDQLEITSSESGINTIPYSAGKLSSGIYLYKLVVDNKIVDTKKMILLK